jgi:hypothetical protein
MPIPPAAFCRVHPRVADTLASSSRIGKPLGLRL